MEIDQSLFAPGGRWFVAVTLPDAIRDDLAALRIEASGIRWTPRDQIHLTLRYIGGADPETVRRLDEGLGHIAVEPFLLTPSGVGRFPPRGNPRVFWAGVGSGHPRLFQLQGKVEETVIAAGLEPETRRFHPHITLARLKSTPAGSVNQFLKQNRDYTAGPFRVDAFSLWVSYLQANGPVHHRAAEYTLEKT
jgi:RNA 2',3'-cyclic 3'-phosphodiesterase